MIFALYIHICVRMHNLKLVGPANLMRNSFWALERKNATPNYSQQELNLDKVCPK